MTLYEIIKALQNASGNLEKQAILLAHKDNPLFKAYMRAVYDVVNLSYYATKLPEPMGMTPCKTATCIDLKLLDELERMIAGRKYTGRAAKEWFAEVLWTLTDEGRELLGYIIDRKIGANVGDTMVLTTWPGMYFIPPYMRCASMDEKAREKFDKEEYFFVETKRDGSFAYLIRNLDHSAQSYTRQGSQYPAWFCDHMAYGIEPGNVFIGEMEVYQLVAGADEPVLMSRKDGNGVLNSISQGGIESDYENYIFRYVAWDRLTLEEFAAGESVLGNEDRFNELERILQANPCPRIELVERHRVTSVAQAKVIHIRNTAAKREGTVWKTRYGLWRDTSSGSKDAVKVKVVFDADYKIVGYYEGKGKAKGMLGGITVETSCGKLRNDCGSGFDDEDRKRFWAIREHLPGMIATLEANDITTARNKATVSLSLPIVLEIRRDNSQPHTFEPVYEQFEAAKLGKKLADKA